MSQRSLGLLAASLFSGLVLSWPTELSAPHALRRVEAPGADRAAVCAPHSDAPQSDARAGRCPNVTAAQGGSADEALADISVVDILDGCMPFMAIDGDRELDFDIADGAVIETVTPSGAPRRDRRSPPRTRTGTFSTSDRAGQVVTMIAGVRRQYTLVIPADGTQCILALGSARSVNLEGSWFGQALEGSEPDPPAYQHTAARRLQRAPGPRDRSAGRSRTAPQFRLSAL